MSKPHIALPRPGPLAKPGTASAWKLPDPPPGEQWHTFGDLLHKTWNSKDLPPGYRPLLDGEQPQEGDEIKETSVGNWKVQDETQRKKVARPGQYLQRTKRPLPVAATWTLPDPPPGAIWQQTRSAKWRKRGEAWFEDMLPPGYRPMLHGEVVEDGDEYCNNNDNRWDVWRAPRGYSASMIANEERVHFRTKRSLLPGVAAGLAAGPWKLPDPPAGETWHRQSSNKWKENMLPAGYRPLLHGEIIKEGDEFHYDGKKWTTLSKKGIGSASIGDRARESHTPFRTKRPLPGAPPAPPPLRISVDVLAAEEIEFQRNRANELEAQLVATRQRCAILEKELHERAQCLAKESKRNLILKNAAVAAAESNESISGTIEDVSLLLRTALLETGFDLPKYGDFLDEDEQDVMNDLLKKVVKKV